MSTLHVLRWHGSILLLLFLFFLLTACSDTSASYGEGDSPDRQEHGGGSEGFRIEYAVWKSLNSTLVVTGEGRDRAEVVFYVGDSDTQIGMTKVRNDDWKAHIHNPSSVPCSLRAVQSNGESAHVRVDNAPADCDSGSAPPPPPPVSGETSINSTSRSSPSTMPDPVAQQDFISSPLYQVLAVNDLGMHCGDLDTRISSILPPFNVLHAQVVERGRNGNNPRILGEGEARLTYSAVAHDYDPILTIAPVLAKDGSLYKTNFWDIARDAYRPFYPSGILDAFYPTGKDIVDIGLPVPDVERFYLEDGWLVASQQAMPGVNEPGLSNALVTQNPQEFHEHIDTMPFFTNFDFGYTAEVNWFEAPGIPIAVFDDFGRENPYPLMRVQAEVNGEVVSTVDTVIPISGEAECQRCHAAPDDGGNGSATQRLVDEGKTVHLSIDDPAENVPHKASVEWASDLNLLTLHDLKHGTELLQEPDPTTGLAPNPIVCQTCHYTPALDLAQLGPLGPENDSSLVLNDGGMVIDSLANGRNQAKHKSMSNVMHGHHANVTDTDGNRLFPDMPPAVDADGNKRDPALTQKILGETCYSCHPGNKTQCMRGAMANGGQVCQDCHGNMAQVGEDFSRNVSPDNVGAFEVRPDFYSNAATPRVPWANEPGCGSCHTGDALDNLAGKANTLVNPVDAKGNTDGIRLAQAFLTGDDKATPIVPGNRLFAENRIEDPNSTARGNPKLYRVSTGHGGLFCESCHGATHAEWPNANPYANDNIAAMQIQGHRGVISECSSCHEGDLGNTLEGPHGMHPVGDTSFSNGGHEEIAERDHGASCRGCHGARGEGTVLARAAVMRVLSNEDHAPVIVAQGEPVHCGLCHENELEK